MKDILFSLLVLSAFLMISCGDDDPMDDCSTAGLTYTNDIATILNTSCATTIACHGMGSAVDDFTTYTGVTDAARFDDIVKAINHDPAVEAMPFGADKLSTCDINKITEWISDGAPE